MPKKPDWIAPPREWLQFQPITLPRIIIVTAVMAALLIQRYGWPF